MMKFAVLILCSSLCSATSTTSCWSGFLSTMNPMPGMLVKSMGNDECTTTTTATATGTSTTTSGTETTQTTTSVTATSITTTSISTTTITTTSVSATATTVTTTSVTATTLTTTSVTATVTTQTTTSVTVTTITTTSITTTSLTATTITTTSTTGTVTTWTTTSVNTTTSATVSTSMTTTETTQTSTSLTVTTITTTSISTTSISTTSLTGTSVTGTSTSVTTSSATMTSTTSSTTTIDCLDPFALAESGEEFAMVSTGGVSAACNGISKSQTCEVVIGGSSASDLSKCVAGGIYTFFCPNISAPSYLYAVDAYIQCRVCAATFVDTDTNLNSFAGKLMFGPNLLNGAVDESMLENYVIMPMDDCGYIPSGVTPLAVVPKSANASDCCETTKYEVDLSLPNFAYNKIVILPAGTNTTVDRLDDGLVVDLVDLTTTSTTITTVTVTTTVVTVTSTGTTTASGFDLGTGGMQDDCTKLRVAVPLAMAAFVQLLGA